MSFLETPRFPEQISYYAIGGSGYNTTVTIINSGFEQRNINWTESRCQYNIQNGNLSYAQVQTIVTFFRCVKGKGYGFRFKDWQDFTADITNGTLGTGIADGTSVDYQMNKVYVAGAFNEVRVIAKPISGTILIYANGVLQVEGTDYTLDYTTGIVTFMSPPTMDYSLTWAGEFDVPVRFDVDAIPGQFDGTGLWIVQALPLIEIRV